MTWSILLGVNPAPFSTRLKKFGSASAFMLTVDNLMPRTRPYSRAASSMNLDSAWAIDMLHGSNHEREFASTASGGVDTVNDAALEVMHRQGLVGSERVVLGCDPWHSINSNPQ